MTYLDCFGLKEPPFSKEIADADLWLPTSKQAVADQLIDALGERASVVLVGEPGVAAAAPASSPRWDGSRSTTCRPSMRSRWTCPARS